MENTKELLTDSLVEDQVDGTIAEETESTDQAQPENAPEAEAPQMSALDALIARRTGFYPINLDLADLKWLKNACEGKFKFTGPNEAFMIMNCYMGFAAAVARLEQEQKSGSESSGAPEIQAAAVEAAAIMINKYEGSSLESAKRIFRIAIALNSAVMEMKQLDQMINQLKIEEAKQDELNKAEAPSNPN